MSDHFADRNAMVLETLMHVCGQGEIVEEAFIIEEKDICVYADVIMVKNNVAQITFQIHHGWLDSPVIESVAASGSSSDGAIESTVEEFYENILSVFIKAVDSLEIKDNDTSITKNHHVYQVVRSKINGIGKREGILEGDFWDMLKDEIHLRLGSKKVTWIKVFTSKNKNNVVCDVRINGLEISELSEKLLAYAESWDCLGTYHTEKQYIMLVQEDICEEESSLKKDDIITLTEKSIKLFEKCKGKDDYLKIRKQLQKLTNDASIIDELYGIIPEIYCMYAYPKVEFGDKLYLLRKDMGTKELYQSQLASFAYILDTVMMHLRLDKVSIETIESVTQFSANARAIRQALQEGSRVEELMLPGIGFYVNENYHM